jgi:hypothetical protein
LTACRYIKQVGNRHLLREKINLWDSPKGRLFGIILLFLFWLSVQISIYAYLGIRRGSDTTVYAEAAAQLLSGQWPEGRLVWYSTYIAFLAMIFAVGGGFQLVAILQILLSGVAAMALGLSVKKMTSSFWTSCWAVLLYLFWFKIHQWNIFIYTESLFTSLALISFAVLLRIKTPFHYLCFFILFVLTFFVRPTGFCLLIGLVWYTFRKSALPGKKKLALGIIIFIVSMILLNGMLYQFELMTSYAQGEIIYPGVSLGFQVPADLIVPDSSHAPLLRLGLFIFYNPLYFAKITLAKMFLFLANIKPYFSILHNTLIVLVLYPLYGFAFLGFRQFPIRSGGQNFIIGFVLAQIFTVMLTTENWDGRFLIPILPFVFVLSVIGIHKHMKRLL